MTDPAKIDTRYRSVNQSGMALMVVMVVLAMGSLLALGAARSSWLNEHIVSSQSDQQRTYAAAEALLKDAQDDIRGQRADGSACSSEATHTGCRGPWADKHPFFPRGSDDLRDLAERIGPDRVCRHGICLPPSVTHLNAQGMAQGLVQEGGTGAVSGQGATYGQYTGTTTRQPLLSGPSARAWYWVEVFQLDRATDTGLTSASQPFIYRINAYVQGHKRGTQVLLRTLFLAPIPSTAND
jgi:type IV pilus assembly protein PilX